MNGSERGRTAEATIPLIKHQKLWTWTTLCLERASKMIPELKLMGNYTQTRHRKTENRPKAGTDSHWKARAESKQKFPLTFTASRSLKPAEVSWIPGVSSNYHRSDLEPERLSEKHPEQKRSKEDGEARKDPMSELSPGYLWSSEAPGYESSWWVGGRTWRRIYLSWTDRIILKVIFYLL